VGVLTESVSRTAVRFSVEYVGEVKGEFIRFLAPRTVEALLRAMPINGITALMEGAVYFEVPVKVGGEKSKMQVEAGTIAYLPLGSALCVFFNRAQPYSPVNVVGKVTDNLEMFKQLGSGKRIRMERI